MPRFEIEVPEGSEEAFRTHVADFPSAIIVFDESARKALQEARARETKQLLADRIVPMMEVTDGKRIPEMQVRYERFLRDVFGRSSREEVVAIHLDTGASLEVVKQATLASLLSISPQSAVGYIDKFGLAGDEMKNDREVAELLHIGQSTVSTNRRESAAIICRGSRQLFVPRFVALRPKQIR